MSDRARWGRSGIAALIQREYPDGERPEAQPLRAKRPPTASAEPTPGNLGSAALGALGFSLAHANGPSLAVTPQRASVEELMHPCSCRPRPSAPTARSC